MKYHLGRKRHFNTWLIISVALSISFSFESLIISSYIPWNSYQNFQEKIQWLHIIFWVLSLKQVRRGGRICFLTLVPSRSSCNFFELWFPSAKRDRWTRIISSISLSPVNAWQEVLRWRRWPGIRVSQAWGPSDGCSVRRDPAHRPQGTLCKTSLGHQLIMPTGHPRMDRMLGRASSCNHLPEILTWETIFK